MPDRPLTIATYAAGASLAAITLVYVFGPTFFLDDEAANSSKSARKKGVVGLVNPANDCFINSVLQALAGLPELRAYLIREVHRRKLDGDELYQDLTAALEAQSKQKEPAQKLSEWKILGFQQGLVTSGLKEVLDALNERPIYKKTISAQTFIRCVEQAFRTRISRTQQDAQEFLQVIVERLAEEYYAGKRVRRHARQSGLIDAQQIATVSSDEVSTLRDHTTSKNSGPYIAVATVTEDSRNDINDTDDPEKDENIFPLEGKLESQVECLFCHFKPKPSASSFLTLTLTVPHDSTSSTLNQCFDQVLKQEYIEDYKCDKCRLVHALEVTSRNLAKASAEDREGLELDLSKIQGALAADPEAPPKDVKLPNLADAPKRKISRFTRIASFPEVLAIHLSRSVWDVSSASSKNTAKVLFPESLPLGGLLHRKRYRLLGVVTHKGGHNSGHYESFRRQVLTPPFSTPANMGTEGVYSIRNTPTPSPRLSAVPSPQLTARTVRDSPLSSVESQSLSTDSQLLSTPTSITTFSSHASSSLQFSATGHDRRKQQPPIESVPAPGLPTPPQSSAAYAATPETTVPSTEATKSKTSLPSIRGLSRRNRSNDRWWRISDDKVKECKTSDVLGMQKEVYMLFYEIVPEET